MGYVIYFFSATAPRVQPGEKSAQDYGYWTGRKRIIDRQNHPVCFAHPAQQGVRSYTTPNRAKSGAKLAMAHFPLVSHYAIEEQESGRLIFTDFREHSNLLTPEGSSLPWEKNQTREVARYTYPYMTEEEESYIRDCYGRLLRSRNSIENVVCLLGAFSTQIQKPLFEAAQSDAVSYVKFLMEGVKSGKKEENTCCSVFFKLRSFYEFAEQQGVLKNPFASLKNPFEQKNIIHTADLISLTRVDHLISLCQKDPQLLLAVLFAFRMGLFTREIIAIKKTDLVVDEGDGEPYLKARRYSEAGELEDYYLSIPPDVWEHITTVLEITADEYPYLLQSRFGKPFSMRGIQAKIRSVQSDTEDAITFRDLRNLFLFLMVFEQIPLQKIASYAGVKGDWLHLYDRIPDELKLDAVKLLHIRIE